MGYNVETSQCQVFLFSALEELDITARFSELRCKVTTCFCEREVFKWTRY